MNLKLTKNSVRWFLIFIAIVFIIVSVTVSVWGVIHRDEVIGMIAGYDLDWMVGKTLEEVVERYGMFDGWWFDGSGMMDYIECAYHISGKKLWLSIKSDGDLSDPESVVTSATVRVAKSGGYSPYDWSGYEDFFCGKTLEEVFSCVGNPVWYNEQLSAVAYQNGSFSYDIIVLSLDGNWNSPDSVVVEFETVESLETESGWVLLSEDVIL